NTQPPEGGWQEVREARRRLAVSTHSRPKAAGGSLNSILFTKGCFNTQPPEGGWPILGYEQN
ncbi:hypothetical protein, partial [Neisseria sp. HMSC056A04]|uniref:hypothetical protein n=1 Tax=Neisseria sp. HMSC056A04 TaxID=1715047 RepID=UPI001AEF5159